MTRRVSERGFTLLELLVASMLLAMLITILTMVFNSSSIAWSTGKASVVEMDEVRRNMSAASIVADNAIPRVDPDSPGTWGYLVGPWDSENNLRPRAIQRISENKLANPTWSGLQMEFKSPSRADRGPGKWARASSKKLWAWSSPGNVSLSGKVKAYVVGVWSLGPDGEMFSGDDICTWPDAD